MEHYGVYRPFAVVGLANLPDLLRYAVNFAIIFWYGVRVEGSGEVCLAAAASCAMHKLRSRCTARGLRLGMNNNY
jgi:hypothetical protein